MKPGFTAIAIVIAGLACNAQADVITDWNTKTHGFIAEAKLGTPPAMRVVAMVQTAAYAAAIAASAPTRNDSGSAANAAVAAAHRAMLVKLIPGQLPAIDAAYQSALASIADGPAKTAGIAAGEKAAADVLAHRAADNPAVPEAYRPHASAGAYVPTATPAVPQWPQRKPWLMASPAQFRPAAPPALTSDAWARDYNEVKTLGSKASTARSAEQGDIARFWEYSLPAIYYGVVRSVADQAGRDVVRNARLYAAVAQAMDDALISVFEAKYHYNFWRPSTAIRNGDIDGHEGTQRDASWASLIDAPLHPEYPSGHGILAGAVGAVLKADVGAGVMPALSTTSPTAKDAARHWNNIDDFVTEVGNSRIYAGIHFRTASETGAAMGRRIGELAVAKVLKAESLEAGMIAEYEAAGQPVPVISSSSDKP